KRGRITIARRKPVPTDLKTDLQLAQRQVYREAVAAWNALTPEEQEAYRGVCPGLTPYQCYMKTALLPAPPPPPPEEYIEEQTEQERELQMGSPNMPWAGQKLTIPNRRVTKLAFVLNKTGSPTGNITFTIRKVTDDSLIASKLWGDASLLTTEPTWYEKEFDTPVLINGLVYILMESEAPYYTDIARLGYMNADVKPDEHFCYYLPPDWT
ncbi:unnamed protein product, partial [marine sediment metagenome]